MIKLPDGFQFTHGDSIHTSKDDPHPHLTGTFNGITVHIPYYGQTTLGMFDRSLPGHRIGEMEHLHKAFPSVFKDSGLKW
jgi:hypothetical protein